jgi:hypothetical protein
MLAPGVSIHCARRGATQPASGCGGEEWVWGCRRATRGQQTEETPTAPPTEWPQDHTTKQHRTALHDARMRRGNRGRLDRSSGGVTARMRSQASGCARASLPCSPLIPSQSFALAGRIPIVRKLLGPCAPHTGAGQRLVAQRAAPPIRAKECVWGNDLALRAPGVPRTSAAAHMAAQGKRAAAPAPELHGSAQMRAPASHVMETAI